MTISAFMDQHFRHFNARETLDAARAYRAAQQASQLIYGISDTWTERLGHPLGIGVGLHTGAGVRLRLRPADPGAGIVFRRVDLPGKPEVPARVAYFRASRAAARSATERPR